MKSQLLVHSRRYGGNNPHRVLVSLLCAVAIASGIVGVARAAQEAQERYVLLVEVNGIISPVTEGFIARAVRQAEEESATLLVIKLDTPGGRLDSTRKITQHLLNAKVPSVVFVAPRGAGAVSAGTFITAAATFAVMAPGTNIGAASPVAGGGQDLPDTLKSKAFNDAAAEMRSIAALRGRNQEKLEGTVLEALSFTAEEAMEHSMVDFIAGDLSDLLKQLNGREAVVRPPGGRRVVLDTQGLAKRTMEPSLVERFLRFLSDPTVSFMLLSLGSLGIFLEMVSPGAILPGVLGVILLVLGIVTVGNLPVNWGGVVLIFFAVVLAVLEFYVAGFGVLGIGAIVSFLLGGLFLFSHTGVSSPTMPRVSVSLWALVPTVLMLGGGGAWVSYTLIRSRRGQPELGVGALVGQLAEVITDLAPRGTVRLENQLWTAAVEDNHWIRVGEKVRVVQVDGIILTVARLDNSSQVTSQTH